MIRQGLSYVLFIRLFGVGRVSSRMESAWRGYRPWLRMVGLREAAAVAMRAVRNLQDREAVLAAVAASGRDLGFAAAELRADPEVT